jgi:SAM-dependent methyltransferase
VHAYEHFARHFDEVTGSDPLANVERVRGYLHRHQAGASSLLELGCGTGQVLAGLPAALALTGVDRSPQMLSHARARVPRARLIEGDMTELDLGEHFDAVVCAFDTLNHLTDFGRWRALFACAAKHLRDGGLFAFDVNTVGQLRRLGAAPPWSCELRGATVTQHVDWHGCGRATWHVLIDERGALHHERIGELGVALAAIEEALAGDFTVLERADDDGGTPTDESVRAYLACRRRERI